MITNRRSFIGGLAAALVTAPAIVRAGSLMPVKQMIAPVTAKGEIYRVISVLTRAHTGIIEVGLGRDGLEVGSFMTDWANPHLLEVGGINVGDLIRIETN